MGANLVRKDWTQCQYFWMIYERESKFHTLTVSEHIADQAKGPSKYEVCIGRGIPWGLPSSHSLDIHK